MCAPAGPVPAEGVRPGLDALAQHFDLVVADDLCRADGFLAGSDDRRAEELNAALRDPDVRAIWIARGGYGLTRILPRLDAAALRADPVPIVGFSDATAILSWARCAGVRAVHGPVVTQLGALDPSDLRWAVQLVTGEVGAGAVLGDELEALAAAASPTEGPLVGGNLSLLAHLAGTRWQVDADGALVVVEDVGERPYAIDRYLTHLELAGGLRGARGLLAGDFTRCDETRGPARPDAFEVVGERAAAFGLPAWRGLPVGHGAVNRAWPYGGAAVLEGGALRLLDGAVA